jgi:hypothetical protein
MRRIVVLLAAMGLMVVMMAVSAAPAFALPPNPVRGQEVAFFAWTLPPNPVGQLNHGQLVSAFARGLPIECGPDVASCPTT